MSSPLKIIVNDTVLDLFEGTEFYFTEAIHDLTNLQTRNGSLSPNISVPKTSTNQAALFDSAPILANQQRGTIRLPCQILFRGTPIINRGEVSLGIEEDDSYGLEFAFKNSDFYQTIQGQLVSELEWGDLNFTMDLAGWDANHTNTKDLVTALTQYFSTDDLYKADIVGGGLSAFTGSYCIDFAGFHLYLKSIARRIVEQHGFEFDDSQMLTITNYETAALSCPVDKFLFDYGLANPVSAFVNSNVNQTESAAGSPIEERIDFLDTTGDPGGLWTTGSMQWNIPFTASLNVVLTLTVDITLGGGSQDTQIRIYKNTDIIAVDYSLPSLGTGVHDIDLSVITDVVAGDIIYATIYISRQSTSIIQSGAQFNIQDIRNPSDRAVNVAEYIPEIDQSRFLQSFANLFGAVIDTNELTRTVFFEPLSNILTAEQQDLTNNRDISRPTEKSYFLPYFQESIFKYADSPIRRTDVNATFRFNGELLDKRGVLIDVAFEASDNSIYDGSLYILEPCMEYPAFNIDKTLIQKQLSHSQNNQNFQFIDPQDFKVGDYLESHNFTGGTRELKRIIGKTSETQGTVFDNWTNPVAAVNVDCSIYKFDEKDFNAVRISNIRNNQTYGKFFGSDTNNNISTGLVAEFDASMTWGALLENYEGIFERLQFPLVIQSWFHFTATEFNQLDLKKGAYLEDFGANFYINKVEQYNPKTQLCRLELIRI